MDVDMDNIQRKQEVITMDIPSKTDTAAIPKKPGSTYQCGNCSTKFKAISKPTVCPKCGIKGSDYFSITYVEYDSAQAQMETEDDWQAGD
jgi:rubrerythrin